MSISQHEISKMKHSAKEIATEISNTIDFIHKFQRDMNRLPSVREFDFFKKHFNSKCK